MNVIDELIDGGYAVCTKCLIAWTVKWDGYNGGYWLRRRRSRIFLLTHHGKTEAICPRCRQPLKGAIL